MHYHYVLHIDRRLKHSKVYRSWSSACCTVHSCFSNYLRNSSSDCPRLTYSTLNGLLSSLAMFWIHPTRDVDSRQLAVNQSSMQLIAARVKPPIASFHFLTYTGLIVQASTDPTTRQVWRLLNSCSKVAVARYIYHYVYTKSTTVSCDIN